MEYLFTWRHQMDYIAKVVLVEDNVEVMGPEALELIKLIDTEKSIKAAASTMKISTAKAWKYIRAIEKHLGEAAVRKNNRGEDNYNIHISPACRAFIEKYENFIKKNETAIAKNYEQFF